MAIHRRRASAGIELQRGPDANGILNPQHPIPTLPSTQNDMAVRRLPQKSAADSHARLQRQRRRNR